MNDTPPATGAPEPLVLRQDRDGIASLTLNRPQARNALSVGLMSALQKELDAIHADSSVRVVVLAGAGPAFCAGHDLKEMRANPDRAAYEALFVQCSRLMLTVNRIRQPVIAKVHGIATAAGCQLVATCDLAYCADTARFATPGVNIGLFCSTPMVALSRAVGRKAAMEMLLLGDLIDAAEAERAGLVSRIVPAVDLVDEAVRVAEKIAKLSRPVVMMAKDAVNAAYETTLTEGVRVERRIFHATFAVEDQKEGMAAFAEKRQPDWKHR